MADDFTTLVGEELADILATQEIVTPTAIQLETIPAVLNGEDVIASSETGSGKTLAYLLPMMKKVDHEIKSVQGIVLTPTHELATQVLRVAEEVGKKMNPPVEAALIIGQVNISRQVERLKEKPQLVIGSVGRILELIQMKKMSAHHVKTIVIDEADKLLDRNNLRGIQALVKSTLRDRQILMFSASISQEAEKIGKEMMNNPHVVRVARDSAVPTNIEHMCFPAQQRDKVPLLRKILFAEKVIKGIVFVNNPVTIEKIAEKLNFHNIKAAALFGSARKIERKKALDDFRKGKVTVLVASDMAARGLDIQGLTHIINLDVPEESTDYLHRAGRVGRMGRKGTVVSIATEYEEKHLRRYERAFHIEIGTKKMTHGKIATISELGREKTRAEESARAEERQEKHGVTSRRPFVKQGQGRGKRV